MSANNPFLLSDVSKAWAAANGRVQVPTTNPPQKLELEPNLPQIVSAANLLCDSALSQPPQLIHGLLHQSLKCIVGGPSKAGKTWLLLDMALSVASGLPWLAWQCERAKVLFVNFEIPPYFIQERIRAILLKKEGADCGNLDLWNLRGFAAPFDTLLPTMEERLKQKYGLVIIDPFYKGMSGDENKAGDIARTVNDLEKLCVKTGAALVFAHHFSKGNKANTDVIDRLSGSGVFGRDPDTIISLTEHKVANCFAVETVVRNLPKPPDFVIERTFPLVTLRPDLDPTKLKSAGGRPEKNVTLELLQMIKNTPLRTNEWQVRAADELGIKKTPFSERKAILVIKKWINQDRTNMPWKITEEGEKELQRLLAATQTNPSDEQTEE